MYCPCGRPAREDVSQCNACFQFVVGDRVRVVGGSSYHGYEGRVNRLGGKLAAWEVGTDVKPNSTGCLVFPKDQLVLLER